MVLVLTVLICLLMLILAYQDFASRKVLFILMPILFSLLIYRGIIENEFKVILTNTAINLIFILIQFLILTIYFSLKNKKFLNIIDNYIGIGDLLMFIVLSCCFAVFNFIVFIILSLSLLLLIYTFGILFKKIENKKIPLAGFLAVVFVIFDITLRILGYNFFSDNLLMLYNG